MNKIYAVYGAAGCGRSLMPIAREHIATGETIYFIDDALTTEQQINGHTTINYEMFKAMKAQEKYVLIAIANSNIRQKLAEKLTNDGINIWTVKSQSTVIMDNVIIGNGDFIAQAKAGITIEAENPFAIAKAIDDIYEMTIEQRNMMGQNGREFALNNFDYAKIAKKLSTILFEA